MDRLKLAHTIKSKCMAVRMLDDLIQKMTREEAVAVVADMPQYLRDITDMRGYTHRAMSIAERLLK
jgi:hypothetical protein